MTERQKEPLRRGWAGWGMEAAGPPWCAPGTKGPGERENHYESAILGKQKPQTHEPRSRDEGVLWPLHKADSLSEAEWHRFEEGLRTFGIDVKSYPNLAALKPEAEKTPSQKTAKKRTAK